MIIEQKRYFIRKGECEMKDTWNEQERLEIEAEQEMIVQVERENWMEANNISYEY
ncbi:hypothetical protein bthur0001_41370 [Bacillus thuringiensis serovar tochigiensis BGSC 4Y1]|nr:hypothetical protein bthur0001_41370 [Bacillus thuringiensis serovar tochigiensis BGSC 4Y1]